MKKIATLLLAAGLLFSAAGMAQAIDFKIRGQWIMAFDYGEHGAFTGGNGMTGYKKGNEDNFEGPPAPAPATGCRGLGKPFRFRHL